MAHLIDTHSGNAQQETPDFEEKQVGHDVLEAARCAWYHVPDNPVGKCRLACDELSAELERRGVAHTVVQGTFEAHRVGGRRRAPHWFITLRDGKPDATWVKERTTVLDPTVHQFARPVYEGDSGAAASVPVDTLPGIPVIPATHPLREAYSDNPYHHSQA